MNTSIPNWLVQRTYLTPNRLALSYQGRTWTFQEMMEEVERVIHGILPLKLECGERVAILMKNRPNTVWTIHALQQLGVETVFLNTRLTVQELLFQLNDSETRHILYDRDFTEIIKSLEVEMNIEVHSIDDLLHIKQEQFHMRKEFNLEDVCSIMYTSGTTGSPKGVLQTYGNHWWSAIGSSLNLGLDQKDAWLCAVPLYHISGLSIFMRSVIYGMPVYLMDQFDEAQSIMLLRSGKITIMSVVTTMLNRLIRSLDEEVIHPNFRCMLLGGGPAPLPLLQKCLSKQIPVFQSYTID